MNIMDYLSLCSDIPKQWLKEQYVKNIENISEQTEYVKLMTAKPKVCNMVYWHLIQQYNNIHKKTSKWEDTLNIHLDENEWGTFFNSLSR